MFKVYFSEKQYYSKEQFQDIFSALEYSRKKGLETRIDQEGDAIASWSPRQGIGWYKGYSPLSQLTTEQSAFLLGLSRARIVQLCQEGRLGNKVGRDYLITLAELEKFSKVPRRSGRPKQK